MLFALWVVNAMAIPIPFTNCGSSASDLMTVLDIDCDIWPLKVVFPDFGENSLE